MYITDVSAWRMYAVWRESPFFLSPAVGLQNPSNPSAFPQKPCTWAFRLTDRVTEMRQPSDIPSVVRGVYPHFRMGLTSLCISTFAFKRILGPAFLFF